MYIYMYMYEASIPMNHYVLPLWSPPRIFYVNFLQSCAALGSLHLPSSHQQHPENRVTSEWATLGPFYQSLAWEFYKLLVLQSTRQKFWFLDFFFLSIKQQQEKADREPGLGSVRSLSVPPPGGTQRPGSRSCPHIPTCVSFALYTLLFHAILLGTPFSNLRSSKDV